MAAHCRSLLARECFEQPDSLVFTVKQIELSAGPFPLRLNNVFANPGVSECIQWASEVCSLQKPEGKLPFTHTRQNAFCAAVRITRNWTRRSKSFEEVAQQARERCSISCCLGLDLGRSRPCFRWYAQHHVQNKFASLEARRPRRWLSQHARGVRCCLICLSAKFVLFFAASRLPLLQFLLALEERRSW